MLTCVSSKTRSHDVVGASGEAKIAGMVTPEADKPPDTCLPVMWRAPGRHKATRSTLRLSTGYQTRLKDGGQASEAERTSRL